MAYDSNMRPMDIAGPSPNACIDAADWLGLELLGQPRAVMVQGKRIWFMRVITSLDPRVVADGQLLADGGDVHANIISRCDPWGCIDKCDHAMGEHFWHIREARQPV